MRNKGSLLSAEGLRALLEYDPASGVFHWKIRPHRGRTLAGALAGSLNRDGYRVIMIKNRAYMAHRLAWLHVHGEWPRNEVDHANRIRSDNRIANLREATRTQNRANTTIRRNNTSGFKGVTLLKKPWRARIKVNGKIIELGKFKTAEEAHAAYVAAAEKYHGEYAYAGVEWKDRPNVAEQPF